MVNQKQNPKHLGRKPQSKTVADRLAALDGVNETTVAAVALATLISIRVAADEITDDAIRSEIQDSADLVRHLIEGEANESLIAKLPQIQAILDSELSLV